MKKARATKPKPRVEIEPFNKRKVDPAKFPLDLTIKDIKKLFRPVLDFGRLDLFIFPIETISPVKTVGKARTNLTLIRPTILQTDAATPHAGFDRRESPTRDPAVSIHFEPKGYGITSVSTYLMVFRIEAFGSCKFSLSGFAGGGTFTPSSRTVNGQTTISLVFRNVPPSAQIFGAITQTAGVAWQWFSTSIEFPPLVFTLP